MDDQNLKRAKAIEEAFQVAVKEATSGRLVSVLREGIIIWVQVPKQSLNSSD